MSHTTRETTPGRHRWRRTAATLLVAALAAPLLTTTAGAQTFGPMELDDHEGVPGDVVTGQVNPAVVAEECPTEPADLLPWFITGSDFEPVDGELGPVTDAWMSLGPLVGIEPPPDGDWPGQVQFGFPSGGWGPPPAGVPEMSWAWKRWPSNALQFGDDTGWAWNREIQAASAVALSFALLGEVPLQLARETIFPELFIFAFADIETQQPLGELSNFDPATGESVEDPPLLVPDLEPGIWPVITTCIEFEITEESFMRTVAAVAEAFEENDIPLSQDPHAGSVEYIEMVTRTALMELATPGGGPWVDLYCVLDADGVCHPELRGIDLDDLTEEQLEQLEEFGELSLEDGVGDPDGDLVVAESTPRFTG